MQEGAKPPVWFWVIVAILLLWAVAGVAGYHIDLAMSAADRAKLDAYDQHFYAHRPSWFVACYGIAVWTGLVGSLLLLFRKYVALPVYVISFGAVIIMFGWMFVATDIVAHKGAAIALGFPILIALMCAVEIGFSVLARRRSWIS